MQHRRFLFFSILPGSKSNSRDLSTGVELELGRHIVLRLFQSRYTRSYNVQNGMRGERMSLEKCEGMLQLNPSANLVGA